MGGANCCSNSKENREINVQRKLTQKHKGAENIKEEDLLFKDEEIVTQGIDCDLYSDFSSTKGDSESEEETDWEIYEKDLTLERKGEAKNMFKKEIIKETLEHAPKELRKVYKQYGQVKVKTRDIPEEIKEDEIEFRREGIKNEAGDVYVGELRKGTNIREGRGLLLSTSSLKNISSSESYIYEGFWIDDQKYGFGRLISASGCVYQGNWVNDKSEGKGLFISGTGVTYKGEWKNNKCQGKGFEKYEDGSKFKGMFEDGEKNGKGFFKWADGREYKGLFNHGSMEGKSKFQILNTFID